MVASGLLFYPVLMAADVLAYRAHEVPVGEDQREHIELMRDAARALQRALRRDCWWCPRRGIPQVGARILDLQDPTRKMSTTGGTEQGTVYVLDEPDVVPQEVQARADRLGARDRARAGQARRHAT